MAVCDSKIANDFLLDCANKPVAGLETYAVLINRDDIDFDASTFDALQANILKTIVLKTGKKGYQVQQMKNSFNGTMWEQVEGDYINGTKHVFAFVNPDRTAKGKELDGLLLNGKFVAVIVNQTAPDNGKFEVLGWNTGLKVPTAKHDYVQTSGVTVVTLASLEQEPDPPYPFFNTDLATTRTAFETLYARPA